MTEISILAAYLMGSLCLLSYGLNAYLMVILYLRAYPGGKATRRQRSAAVQSGWSHSEQVPSVTTQVPLYNELNVAERVIRAVAAMDYPEGKHEIQILDDSTDETEALVDRVASSLRETGIDIQVVRRPDRVGFKAGALETGRKIAKGEFLAVFDSDFVPKPDFLKKLMPYFLEDEEVGLVQARWGHLNGEDSLLTRAQSLGIDGHFTVEQSARASTGLFMSFNGSAGMWRRRAIEEAGGWKHDTLTEDLDLSYRAQLVGWKACFVPEVVAPAELPDTVAAFKSQQFRWAKGSMQTAVKLLPSVFRSECSWVHKVSGFFHLTHFAIHPCLVFMALLSLPFVTIAGPRVAPGWFVAAALILSLASLAPSALYWYSQKHAGIPRRFRLMGIPLVLITGVGIAISNARAVGEALMGRRSDFIRTPKCGDATRKAYRAKMPLLPLLEIGLSGYCCYAVVQFSLWGHWFLAPFQLINAVGFGYIGLLGILQSLWSGQPPKRSKRMQFETAPVHPSLR